MLVVLAFALGFCVGGRHEARYWAMHDGGTPVHHRKRFYYVRAERSEAEP